VDGTSEALPTTVEGDVDRCDVIVIGAGAAGLGQLHLRELGRDSLFGDAEYSWNVRGKQSRYLTYCTSVPNWMERCYAATDNGYEGLVRSGSGRGPRGRSARVRRFFGPRRDERVAEPMPHAKG
jgi:hypothetical protein